MNTQFNKRNIVDWIIIFIYIAALFTLENPLHRSYVLLGVSVVGILISSGILLFSKNKDKTLVTRETIAIVLLCAAALFAIYSIYSA